jgi:hypothetical protein
VAENAAPGFVEANKTPKPSPRRSAEATERCDLLMNWDIGPIGIVGVIVGLIGICVAIRFKSRVRIACLVQQTQLLGGVQSILPNEIAVFYKDQKIQKLFKFNVIMWNSGNVPIRHRDIVEHDPIILVFSDEYSLLKASLLKCGSIEFGVGQRREG